MTGEAFYIDSTEVYTFIVNFVAGNETGKAKIQPYNSTTNGRMTFKSLFTTYEGVGLHSVDMIKTDKLIDSLFYAGEKKPTYNGKSLKNN